MLWKQTNGWSLNDFGISLAIEDDYELGAEEKAPFVSFSCSAASKSIVLGLDDADCMIVANIGGTNAVTVKAIKGDTGTSVAAGKVAIVIGSTTANASKIYVLN
jgi:hypothetical protein